MKDMFNKYVGILLSGSAFTYLIAKAGSWLVNNGYSFLRIGTSDGWIQFFGTIIGALVTILTVIDALKSDKDIQHDEYVKSHMPYIYIQPIYNENDGIYLSRSYSHNQIDNHSLPIWFVFNNLTNNAAKLLDHKDQKFYVYSNTLKDYELWDNNKVDIIQGFTPILHHNLFVGPNEKDFNKFNFNIFYTNKATLFKFGKFKIELTYTYRDILDLAEYEHTYVFEFYIQSTGNGGAVIRFDYENNIPERTLLDIYKVN